MNATTFIGVIQSLSGLTPAMVLHLTGLSERMSDNEREQAAAAMKEGSDNITAKAEQVTKVLNEGLDEITMLEKDGLPAIHKQQESSDQAQDMKSVESSMNSL